jgi:formate-dependent nitrite reductase cytochrome c552 subunit
MADNSACFVCHGNYDEEELALLHAKEEIGCVDCHGDSFDHRNDEDNVTPPDVMYWPARIDEACQECHDTHDVSAREVLKRWQERCPEKRDYKQVVCTDCHGYHRLQRRTVRWNKKTGELIVNAEATKPQEPAEKPAN